MRLRICKILSPLLLLPVLLPVFVALLITVKRENIRHEIKERLEDGLLHTILVKNNEYAWVKAGKEILVNGRMFDVKNHTSQNGETIFTGLYDDEETALNSIADNLWKKQSEKKNALLAQLVQLLHGFFHQQDEGFAPPPIPKNIFLLIAGEDLPLAHRTIITPPPQG